MSPMSTAFTSESISIHDQRFSFSSRSSFGFLAGSFTFITIRLSSSWPVATFNATFFTSVRLGSGG